MWLQRIVYVVFNTMSMNFAMFSKNLEYLGGIIRMCEQVAASGNTLILYSA